MSGNRPATVQWILRIGCRAGAPTRVPGALLGFGQGIRWLGRRRLLRSRNRFRSNCRATVEYLARVHHARTRRLLHPGGCSPIRNAVSYRPQLGCRPARARSGSRRGRSGRWWPSPEKQPRGTKSKGGTRPSPFFRLFILGAPTLANAQASARRCSRVR